MEGTYKLLQTLKVVGWWWWCHVVLRATLCTGYDCTVVYYYHLYCCKLQVLYVMCHVPQSVFCYLLSVLVQFCTDLIIALELLSLPRQLPRQLQRVFTSAIYFLQNVNPRKIAKTQHQIFLVTKYKTQVIFHSTRMNTFVEDKCFDGVFVQKCIA